MKATATCIVLFAFLAVLSFGIYPGHAAIFNIADGDVATLKAAIIISNTNGENDIINLAMSGEYVLETVDNTGGAGDNGLPVVQSDSSHSLIVEGNSATIKRRYTPAPPDFRIFMVGLGANVTFRSLTLDGGQPDHPVAGAGAALFSNHATVVFESCVLKNHWAGFDGGAIFSSGNSGTASLTLSACELFFNRGNRGGAIASDGFSGNAVVILTQNHIWGNNATESGGGIYNNETMLQITGGLIELNQGFLEGGGIYHGGDQPSATLSAVDLRLSTNAAVDYGGGGIYHWGPQLTLTRCVFEQNHARGTSFGDGGGLSHNGGNAIVNGCTFVRGTAQKRGGAIYNSALLTASNTIFTSNRADVDSGGDGGGIYNASGASLDLVGCTLAYNAAAQFGGGGVFNIGTVTATNCTFYGNIAPRGGGILSVANNGNSLVTLRNCTIANNTATSAGSSTDGGGGYYGEGAVGNSLHHFSNTILAGNNNAVNPDLRGYGTSEGNNLIGNLGQTGSGFTNGVNSDKVGTSASPLNARFNTFGNHGGPTDTMSLLSNSPAINAGADALAPPRDQRCYLRTGVSDIGAFEFAGTLAPLAAVSRKIHGAGGAFDINLPFSAGATAGVECRSIGATGDHQLVMTFAGPVTVNGNPQAQVTSGTGAVGSGGIPNGGMVTVSGAVVTVPLTSVANAQKIIVTVFGVNDGISTANLSVPISILLGDTNGNGSVNATDVSLTKLKSGQPVDASNFRTDVTVSNSINATDVSSVKLKSGTALP